MKKIIFAPQASASAPAASPKSRKAKSPRRFTWAAKPVLGVAPAPLAFAAPQPSRKKQRIARLQERVVTLTEGLQKWTSNLKGARTLVAITEELVAVTESRIYELGSKAPEGLYRELGVRKAASSLFKREVADASHRVDAHRSAIEDCQVLLNMAINGVVVQESGKNKAKANARKAHKAAVKAAKERKAQAKVQAAPKAKAKANQGEEGIGLSTLKMYGVRAVQEDQVFYEEMSKDFADEADYDRFESKVIDVVIDRVVTELSGVRFVSEEQAIYAVEKIAKEVMANPEGYIAAAGTTPIPPAPTPKVRTSKAQRRALKAAAKGKVIDPFVGHEFTAVHAIRQAFANGEVAEARSSKEAEALKKRLAEKAKRRAERLLKAQEAKAERLAERKKALNNYLKELLENGVEIKGQAFAGHHYVSVNGETMVVFHNDGSDLIKEAAKWYASRRFKIITCNASSLGLTENQVGIAECFESPVWFKQEGGKVKITTQDPAGTLGEKGWTQLGIDQFPTNDGLTAVPQEEPVRRVFKNFMDTKVVVSTEEFINFLPATIRGKVSFKGKKVYFGEQPVTMEELALLCEVRFLDLLHLLEGVTEENSYKSGLTGLTNAKGRVGKELSFEGWTLEEDILSTYVVQHWNVKPEVGISCQDISTVPTPKHGVEWVWNGVKFYTKHESFPGIYNYLSGMNVVRSLVHRNSKGLITTRLLVWNVGDEYFFDKAYGDKTKAEEIGRLVKELNVVKELYLDVEIPEQIVMPWIDNMGRDSHKNEYYMSFDYGTDFFHQTNSHYSDGPEGPWTPANLEHKRILVGRYEDLLLTPPHVAKTFDYVLCDKNRDVVANTLHLKPYGDVEKYPFVKQTEDGAYVLVATSGETLVVMDFTDWKIQLDNLQEISKVNRVFCDRKEITRPIDTVFGQDFFGEENYIAFPPVKNKMVKKEIILAVERELKDQGINSIAVSSYVDAYKLFTKHQDLTVYCGEINKILCYGTSVMAELVNHGIPMEYLVNRMFVTETCVVKDNTGATEVDLFYRTQRVHGMTLVLFDDEMEDSIFEVLNRFPEAVVEKIYSNGNINYFGHGESFTEEFLLEIAQNERATVVACWQQHWADLPRFNCVTTAEYPFIYLLQDGDRLQYHTTPPANRKHIRLGSSLAALKVEGFVEYPDGEKIIQMDRKTYEAFNDLGRAGHNIFLYTEDMDGLFMFHGTEEPYSFESDDDLLAFFGDENSVGCVKGLFQGEWSGHFQCCNPDCLPSWMRKHIMVSPPNKEEIVCRLLYSDALGGAYVGWITIEQMESEQQRYEATWMTKKVASKNKKSGSSPSDEKGANVPSSSTMSETKEDQKEVVAMEKRQSLAKAQRATVRRKADGTVKMTYKNSEFMKLWNEVLGRNDRRPIIPGSEGVASENLQGAMLHMLAFEGTVGYKEGLLPIEVSGGKFSPEMYNQIGFLWKGNAIFGLYYDKINGVFRGKPEDEYSRHASMLRSQYPMEYTQGEGEFNLFFIDFSNPECVENLHKAGAFIVPEKENSGYLQLIQDIMTKTYQDTKGNVLKPEIDGTIWVSNKGPYFAPTGKGIAASTFQFRGTTVYREGFAEELGKLNDEFAKLMKKVVKANLLEPVTITVEKRQVLAGYVLKPSVNKNTHYNAWVKLLNLRGITSVESYLLPAQDKNPHDQQYYFASPEVFYQILVGDLMMNEVGQAWENYWEKGEWGGYLKGLCAHMPFLKKGVVLMDINAVKDSSKPFVKKALKENGGVYRAPEGQQFILGMMQDYSRGGIRVASQASTYIQEEFDGEFVMEAHILRFVDYLTDNKLAMSKGVNVSAIIKNIQKACNFVNAGGTEMGEEFFEGLSEEERGIMDAFWNHPMGRRKIYDLIKTLMNRYRFGFMTNAMKKLGTFGSVKSYITDMNILPPSLPNERLIKGGLTVRFHGEDAKQSPLPLPVYVFKNDKFWEQMGTDHALCGALRYPVSNKSMMAGALVINASKVHEYRKLLGMEGYDKGLIQALFNGLSEGIYANSLTVKELLCGDTDGDTAGLIPLFVSYKINGKTVWVKTDTEDSKFFWAIHETRNLKKRPFGELEGFTGLQGRRQINPAAAEKILGESNKAVGSCALFQQAVTGILNTHDKGMFVSNIEEARKLQNVGQWPDSGKMALKDFYAESGNVPDIGSPIKQIMDSVDADHGLGILVWNWFVERYLEPSYKLLPVLLELAIMCQKKDLMGAYKHVVGLLYGRDHEIRYGQNNERYLQLFDKDKVESYEKMMPKELAIALEQLEGCYIQLMMVSDPGYYVTWASRMGSFTQLMMHICGVFVNHGGVELPVRWLTKTRTAAMAEKENPDTILSDRSESGWGILESDNLAWTNARWVGEIAPLFRALRTQTEALISTDATFSEDQALNFTWNRTYRRGTWPMFGNGLYSNYNCYTGNKEKFLEDIKTVMTNKVIGRLFGMNLHGLNRFDSWEDAPSEYDSCKFEIKAEKDILVMALMWHHIQGMIGEKKILTQNVSDTETYFKSLVGMTKGFEKNGYSYLDSASDAMDIANDILTNKKMSQERLDWFLSYYENFVVSDDKAFQSIKKTLGASAFTTPKHKAVALLCGYRSKLLEHSEYDYMILKLLEFKGWKSSDVEEAVVHARTHLRAFYRQLVHVVENKIYINPAKQKEIVGWWIGLKQKASTYLATPYRNLNRDEINNIVLDWTNEDYQNLWFLGNQESTWAVSANWRSLTSATNEFLKHEALVTDYFRVFGIEAGLPMSILNFGKADGFLMEIVGGVLESERVEFTQTQIATTVLMKNGKTLDRHKPVKLQAAYTEGHYLIEDDVEVTEDVHYIEVKQDNEVVGWIATDPTARILLYFQDNELSVDFESADYLWSKVEEVAEEGKLQAVIDPANNKSFNVPYLYQAPHSVADQHYLASRFAITVEEFDKLKCVVFRGRCESRLTSFKSIVESYSKLVASELKKKNKRVVDQLGYLYKDKRDFTRELNKFAGDNVAEFKKEIIRNNLLVDGQKFFEKGMTDEEEQALVSELIGERVFTFEKDNFEFTWEGQTFLAKDGKIILDEVIEIVPEVNTSWDESVLQFNWTSKKKSTKKANQDIPEYGEYSEMDGYVGDDSEPEYFDYDAEMFGELEPPADLFEDTPPSDENYIPEYEEDSDEVNIEFDEEEEVFEEASEEIFEEGMTEEQFLAAIQSGENVIRLSIEKEDIEEMETLDEVPNFDDIPVGDFEEEESEVNFFEEQEEAWLQAQSLEEEVQEAEETFEAEEVEDVQEVKEPSSDDVPEVIAITKEELEREMTEALTFLFKDVLKVPVYKGGQEERDAAGLEAISRIVDNFSPELKEIFEPALVKANAKQEKLKKLQELEARKRQLEEEMKALQAELEADEDDGDDGDGDDDGGGNGGVPAPVTPAPAAVKPSAPKVVTSTPTPKVTQKAASAAPVTFDDGIPLPDDEYYEVQETPFDEEQNFSPCDFDYNEDQDQQEEEEIVEGKTIIAGSRTITDYNTVVEAIRLSGFEITEVISGGAKGPDKLGETWGKKNNVTVTVMPADWDKYGKSAGYRRNEEMAKYAGEGGQLIAVWDGESKGTGHMINIAKKQGLKVFVHLVTTTPPATRKTAETAPRILNKSKGESSPQMVYVGRSKGEKHWGNPFTVEEFGRGNCIKLFEEWLEGTAHQEVEPRRRTWILDNIETLRGKDLQCFCHPNPCHATVYFDRLYKAAPPKDDIAEKVKNLVDEPETDNNICSLYAGRVANTLQAALTNVTYKAWNMPSINDLEEPSGAIRSKHHLSAEAWYKQNKTDNHEDNFNLMVYIIKWKFYYYPELELAITEKGGEAWIKTQRHEVIGNQDWEGVGLKSEFIRALYNAYVDKS